MRRASLLATYSAILTLSLIAPAFGQAPGSRRPVGQPAAAGLGSTRAAKPAARKRGQTPEPAASTKPIVWSDPGDVASLNFTDGPGGPGGEPKPPFKFLEEDLGGSNPKIKVEDAAGRKWGVKWGTEVNAETFASRMAWATGYFVEPAYFVKSGTITGVTGLGRAKKYVGSDGSFSDARFELKTKGVTKLKDEQGWAWNNNPFVGTKELNGLKIMLMLTSNWDSKDVRDVSRGSNTAIFTVPVSGGTVTEYVFTDWGGSMGKWGGVMGREKWDCKGYQSQTSKFTSGVKGNYVQFGYSGQRTSDVRENISVSDVKWLLQYLGRITDDQIRDGLVASGATPDEVTCFGSAIRERIKQLQAIAR